MRPEAKVAAMDAVAKALHEAQRELGKLWQFRSECPEVLEISDAIGKAVDLATDTETFKAWEAQFEFDREFTLTLKPEETCVGGFLCRGTLTEVRAGKTVEADWNILEANQIEEWAAERARDLNGSIVKVDRVEPPAADLTFRPEAESFDQFNLRYQSAVFDAVLGKAVT